MEFKGSKYKEFARQQLSGRMKVAVVASIFSLVISLIFSFSQRRAALTTEDLNYIATSGLSETLAFLFSNPSSPYSAPMLIISFISMIVGFIIEIALVSLFIVYSRSPDPVSIKVFFEGLNKWGRGILGGLWRGLWTVLWGLIVIPVTVLFSFLMSFVPFYISYELALFFVIIFMFIGFIPMFIKTVEYTFTMFFLAEFPAIGIRKALTLSKKITKGNRWNVFVIELSFIGWFLLGAITVFIGMLWVIPYYYMTMTNVFHALLKDAIETQKILPEDLN